MSQFAFNKLEILKRLEALIFLKPLAIMWGTIYNFLFYNNFPDQIQSEILRNFLNEELNLDLFPRSEYFIIIELPVRKFVQNLQFRFN